jgi:hypothetical protein
VSCFTGLFDDVKAGSVSVTVASDGKVVGTNRILRQGDVYTFTGDIFGSITVEKGGITIDGAGYAIKGWGNEINLKYGEHQGYGDVVVRNVRFCDSSSIYAVSRGNSFINNVFEGGGIEVRGGIEEDGKCNVIKHNVFIDSSAAIWLLYTNWEIISENVFLNCRLGLTFLSGFVVDRNYWSDYTVLYSDAKEIEDTGVWDTPYSYDADRTLAFVDYNPLVNPVKGAGAPDVNEKPTLSVPTTALITVVCIVSLIIVNTSFWVYFKKHK